MFERNIKFPKETSFFLFGPRGTGKSTLIKKRYPDSTYIDLLESGTYRRLLAEPERLEQLLLKDKSIPVVIDEIQRVPSLLNEVHRLIEGKGFHFILTGSNARKLRKTQANLLGGRALKYNLYPLTLSEVGPTTNFQQVLNQGMLPSIYDTAKNIDPTKYLESYVQVYLEEEIMQEGLTRNLDAFTRFLEAASFSQGQQLNVTEVARECAVNRKVVESYFQILYDLFIAYQLPVFKKRAKRKLVSQKKFYFFDVGVYKTIKPKGFLDVRENEEGIIYESLVLQEIIATNSNLNLGYEMSYWRTTSGTEVDFVLHGQKRLIAIEVKRSANIHRKELRGLRTFKQDYPEAELFLFYGGVEEMIIDDVKVFPIKNALVELPSYLQ